MGEEMGEKGKKVPPSGGVPRLKVVEGIAGVWHYHLSESGETGKPALCGNDRVMLTMIPATNWMDKRPSHIPSSYCKACDEVLEARSAPAQRGSIPESPSEAGTLPDSTPTPTERKEP